MISRTAIIFVGPPGSGKGTQVPVLQEEFQFASFSVGDAFRAAIASGSPLGQRVKELCGQGNLVPDEIVLETVGNALRSLDTPRVLLDGFPRTLVQAEGLGRLMPSEEWKIACLFFNVSDDVVLDRISGRFSCKVCGRGYNDKYLLPKVEGVCDVCGGKEFVRRDDDARATVLTRLANYRTMTEPLLDYYRQRKCLFEIQGERSVSEVSLQVRSVVSDVLGLVC